MTAGFAVMKFDDDEDEEESKDEVLPPQKVKSVDTQQKLINAELDEIKDTEDYQQKVTQMDSSLKVRPENDTRIAVIGNVDSGKSTLVGVLTKSIMDDGRGSARKQVFNFSHE